MNENTHMFQEWLSLDAEIRQQYGRRVEKRTLPLNNALPYKMENVAIFIIDIASR